MTDKQRDALGLLIESIHKPDAKLRGCAHNQECYNELMEWRQKVITMLQEYETVSYTHLTLPTNREV